MEPIDWDKCYKGLKEKFPQIKADLEERLESIYETDMGVLVSLDNFPPHVELAIAPRGVLQKREFDEKTKDLGDVIYDIKKEYDLAAQMGFYDPGEKGERRKFNFGSKYHYVFKPKYKNYKK